MDELEALKAVAGFGLLTDGIENGVDEFSALSVITLGPVVAGARLAENEVVWSEELAEWAGTDGVHGAWLKVDKDSTWDVTSTGGFVVVNVDTFDLEFRVSAEFAAWINAVLIGDDFPEFSTDLVTTLAGLDVYDFSHSKIADGV